MRIGLLAYSTNTGLGYQTLEFFRNINPDKVLIADLSRLNGVETHHERFTGARIDKCESYNLLSQESCEWLVDDMDIVFVCETPLNHYIFEYAKRKHVKTVLQYNYEFLAHHKKPMLPRPDVFASPSYWQMEAIENKITKPVYWPVPVDTRRIPFRKIQEAKTFIHIIGRPASHDRNGTIAFLDASIRLKGDFRYKVYLQKPKETRTLSHFQGVLNKLKEAKKVLGNRFEIIKDTPNNLTMYSTGDILVLPRRYGGLCLPMWEALSAGIPVIMTDISPNNMVLPEEWLVSAGVIGILQAHASIPVYDMNTDKLIETMKYVAENIVIANKQARDLAEGMSWDIQKPIYLQRFKDLCE